jgi:hypothetical protein
MGDLDQSRNSRKNSDFDYEIRNFSEWIPTNESHCETVWETWESISGTLEKGQEESAVWFDSDLEKQGSVNEKVGIVRT